MLDYLPNSVKTSMIDNLQIDSSEKKNNNNPQSSLAGKKVKYGMVRTFQ